MRKLLITLLILAFSTTAYCLPPMPMHWGIITGRMEITADTALTTTNVITNRYITNQGAAGEVDIKLPAISFSITVEFVVEETQVIEVNPPTGEIFILDTTTLDANDCVDSDQVVGSTLYATRIKNASGVWQWLLKGFIGTWADTGATD